MQFNIWNINECLKFNSFETAYKIIYQSMEEFKTILNTKGNLNVSYLNPETNEIIDILMWKSFNLINVIIKERTNNDILSNQTI